MSATPFATDELSSADGDRPADSIGDPAVVGRATPEPPVRTATPPAQHPAWRNNTPWRFELFLAFCSAWVATQLWFWPGQFPLGNTPMSLSAGIRGHEYVWAIVCMIAAVLKLGGLGFRLWTQRAGLSAALMTSGLFMSTVLWTIVGASWAFDFPHSLAPIILIGGAVGAAWQLSQWKPPRRAAK